MDAQQTNSLSEHDYEPLPGLPEALPEGEFIRWQGRPDWWDMACSAFHVRKLAVYFLVILAVRLGLQVQQGVALSGTINSTLALATLAVIALGLLSLLSYLMARATSYTLTNQRLVIRSGVAVSMTVNLPFSRVVSADVRERANGFGDIPMLFDQETRPSWIILWPHVRPWRFAPAQPMMRSLPNVAGVARLLSEALREHALEDGSQRAPVRVEPDVSTMAALSQPSAG